MASASSRNNVICLAIDRLHAAYLGAYGNTWINTPALDRLAAESFLLDRAVIDSPQLEVIYRSLWQGLHAMVPEAQAHRHTSLPQQLTLAGWQTVLLSDDTTVAEHPLATAFADRVVLKPSKAHRSIATALEESNAAEFFAAASDQLQRLKSQFLLWLHTSTLGNIWDAPLELREQYRDEDDPPAKDECEVPNQILPEQFDPDELLTITHAYAGQVTLIDELVGSLIASIEESGLAQNTLLVLLSPRGFPLGEHRRVGACDDALYAELTHVPILLRFPDALGAADRSAALVQPADLAATILDWTGQNSEISSSIAGRGRSILPLIEGQHSATIDRACIAAPTDQKVIVTPAWSLRISKNPATSPEESKPQTELFSKPDDWFEVNELSNRGAEVVDQLQAALGEFETACQSGSPATLSKLPGELIHGID